MEDHQKKYINALNVAFSSNIEAVFKILADFEPEKAYNITTEDLQKFNLKRNTISNFIDNRAKINVEKEWQKLINGNVAMITPDEDEYPHLLKEIHKPPQILYVKGSIPQNVPCVSCIGTRWPSDYGKMITPDIVTDLSLEGIVIVSGMARGIDSISHKTAIERGQNTIAILGTGIDIVFPPENAKLAKEIQNNGAIMSEFPLGTPPLQYHFPLRNRIIAGMSDATLVLEAKQKSGALITANLALEEGREVFAVPGPIYSKTSEGCNNLIKQGAHPVTSAQDIFCVFGIKGLIKHNKEIKGNNKEENSILNILKSESATTDEIIKKTKLDTGTVNSAIILLEIEKKIKRSGEKYYINNL
jgi:DNA processing protein